MADVMPNALNDILCNPAGISPEQAAINEAEWRKPENWHGVLFPSYCSKTDTRPFVPGRTFRPKTADDLRWVGVLTRQIPNRGHSRGRIWSILGWAAVIGVAVVWIVLMVIEALR